MPQENIAKNFAKYFRVLTADTETLRKEVYKIRYDVFCGELRTEKDCVKDVEKDKFDDYSQHFLLQHKATGHYAGTVRFVIPPKGTAIKLPCEENCLNSFDPEIIDPSKLPRGGIGEVSRLAVPARFRKRTGEQGKPYIVDSDKQAQQDEERRLFPYISVGLYLSAAAFFVVQELDYAFVMVEPRLARAMARVGIKFEQAGSVVDYHGLRAPFYIDQAKLKENLSPCVLDLFENIKAEVEASLLITNQQQAAG